MSNEALRTLAGDEAKRFDASLERYIDPESRLAMWRVVDRVVNHCDESFAANLGKSGVVLGYVQSGKTTAITALIAAAADLGVNVVIALLGTTNLLLGQNSDRISNALGIRERQDYKWVEERNPSGRRIASEIRNWVDRGRCVLIPVLKHAGRIDAVTDVINAGNLGDSRVLIVDDEADQASPNNAVNRGQESRVYESISRLRNSLSRHCNVQFTATPYALLLLDESDQFHPDFVEFLEPGKGYTGGREFFVDNYKTVVRNVPVGDEQSSRLPISLPSSLLGALNSFLAGSAVLLSNSFDNAPISMLVHPSSKTSIQERYRYLITRHLIDLSETLAKTATYDELPISLKGEFVAFREIEKVKCSNDDLKETLTRVVNEVKIWTLNSTTSVSRVDWNVSPIHILIGGNKLDRGFTVEGLTVTYMNRSASDQIDTTEQRARAFGYRSQYIPFCRFYATQRAVSTLRDIVFTEYDLRCELRDAVERGESVTDWSNQIGLLLPEGTKPTRDAVVRAVTSEQLGWHHIRKPNLDPEVIRTNYSLLDSLGLFRADFHNYGRLSFRTLRTRDFDSVKNLLMSWEQSTYSPNWEREHLLAALSRTIPSISQVSFVLLEQSDEDGTGTPRLRSWREDIGFVNIFQGRDNTSNSNSDPYLGDRAISEGLFEDGILTVQFHRLRPKDGLISEVFVPALFFGNRTIVRKHEQ